MNNLFKLILTSILLVVFSTVLAAQDTLPAITESDYAKWQTLGSFSISDNGFRLRQDIFLIEGDETLYLLPEIND